MTVSAVDKGVGKKESLTITSGRGGLSAEEIEKMVNEAKEYEEEDKAIKEKVDAKNSFDNYIHQMRNSIEDKDKLADKLEENEKSSIKDALTDAQDWLNANPDADKEDFEDKLKEL